MRPAIQILLTGGLSFGVPLLLALRELIVLRRDRDTGEGRQPPVPAPDSPRPLPSCLLVPDAYASTNGQRTRELEVA